MMKKVISLTLVKTQQMDKLTLKAIHVHTMALTQMHVVLLIQRSILQLIFIAANVMAVNQYITMMNL